MSTVGYRLEIRAPRTQDPTEATVLTPTSGAPHSDPFRVTTFPHVAGWKPYLGLPQGRRGRIDLLRRSTDTGEVVFPILDARTSTAESQRWVSAFLGDSNGRWSHGHCLVIAEESRDGGATWTPYYTGRIQSLDHDSRLWYRAVIRDHAQDLAEDTLFPGKPHVNVAGYAQLLSQSPWGIRGAYGIAGGTMALSGTVVATTSPSTPPADIAVIQLDSFGRLDNLFTKVLRDVAGGWQTAPGLVGDVSWTQPSPRIRALLSHAGGSGEFYAGFQWAWVTDADGTRPSLYTITIQPLAHPKGVATGTPRIANAVGYPIGATSVNTDGWTPSQTGILNPGDIISFANHGTRYIVNTQANSNGIGQATLILVRQSGSGGLTAAVIDNELITVHASPGFLALPAVSTAVEVYVVADVPVSRSNPLLVNDVHPAQFMADLAAGYFGALWRPGEDLPPGKTFGDAKYPVTVDTTASAALIADPTFPTVRFVFDARLSRSELIERVGMTAGIGYYFAADGKFTMVDIRFPTSLAGVGTITDADLDQRTAPSWSHDVSNARTRGRGAFSVESGSAATWALASALRGTYPELEDPLFQSTETEVEILGLGNPALADTEVRIAGDGLRAMPGEKLTRGAEVGAVLERTVWCEQVLVRALLEFSRPYGHGPALITLTCYRTVNTDVQPGQLKLLQITSLPDPKTHTLSGTRLVRVTEVRDIGLLGRQIAAVDLGVETAAAVPTITSPATWADDPRNGVTTTILLNGSADPVDVQYAVTATSVGSHPGDTDPIWTQAKLRSKQLSPVVTVNSTIIITPVPSGKRLWVRARSIPSLGAVLQMPSAWAYPSGTQFVDTTALTAPSALTEGADAGVSVEFSFTAGDANRRTRVYLVTPTTDPLEPVMLLPPGQTDFTLHGLTISTSYKCEVRHEDDFGGESAGASVNFTTAGTTPTAPDFGSVSVNAAGVF